MPIEPPSQQASPLKEPAMVERDGTSQSGRELDALRPDYVQVDERTAAELLAFARAYGKELAYYGLAGRTAGDWSSFIDPQLSLAEVEAFLADPSKFDPETSPKLFRPHFTLLLVFLRLLDKLRGEMNTLTARHLDFYYRRILRMARRPSIPDRVSVIVDLAPDAREVLLPKGTLLDAGRDRTSRDRAYATDRDLIVNRTKLQKASSLFIDRRRTGLRDVKTRYLNDRERACENLFIIALGDPLPPYPDGSIVNYAKLVALAWSLQAAGTEFCLSLSDLRDLVARRQLRPPAPAEWDEINAKIEIAGRKKRGDASFTIDHRSTEFDKNLMTAVGTLSFGTLPEVSTLEDVYDLRGRPDVQAFIREKIYFDNLEDFARMMQLKRKYTTEWNEINRILERGGQRKRGDSSYALVPRDIAAFAENLQNAMGVTESRLLSFWNSVTTLEQYFCMPAESFAFAMDEVQTVDEADWEQVFPILSLASKEKLRKDRRAELKRRHEGTPSAALIDLVHYVLDEQAEPGAPDPGAFDRLVPFLGQADTDKLAKLEQEGNWDRIYSLLELAQRNRLGEPEPERMEWLNIYPADDATSVTANSAISEQASPRWHAFGTARPQRTLLPTPRPVLGFALCSPLFLMQEGARVITLTLGFRTPARPLAELLLKSGQLPLLFQISTDKGWVECSPQAPKFDAYEKLAPVQAKGRLSAVQIVLPIAAGVDPIAPLGAASVASGESSTRWPCLRMMMRPLWSDEQNQYIACYPELSQLELVAVHTRVEVQGLKSLTLQNDDAQLEAKGPFLPFGSTPAVGRVPIVV
jgi:hypothetical protein